MNPEQPMNINSREAKHLRIIITTGLLLVLVAILAAYIYYGMRLAQQAPADQTVETETESVSPDQAEILKALEAAPVATEAEAEAVLNALEDAPSAENSDRTAILEALQ